MLESRDGCGPCGPTRATSVDHGGAAGTPLRGGFRAAVKIAFTVALAILVGSCGGTAASTPTPSAASKVPCGPTEVFTRHEHAHLTIVVRGQLRVVPAFIGITTTSICWLHTHDTSGIIHIEAGDNRQVTLGDFFSVWGKPLSKTAVADDRASDGESVQATLNQKPYADAPETIVLHDHDDIDLELGPPLPTVAPYVWPPGY